MTAKAILSVTLILFSVIDIIGSLPIIINMKKEGIKIQAGLATIAAAIWQVRLSYFL